MSPFPPRKKTAFPCPGARKEAHLFEKKSNRSVLSPQGSALVFAVCCVCYVPCHAGADRFRLKPFFVLLTFFFFLFFFLFHDF